LHVFPQPKRGRRDGEEWFEREQQSERELEAARTTRIRFGPRAEKKWRLKSESSEAASNFKLKCRESAKIPKGDRGRESRLEVGLNEEKGKKKKFREYEREEERRQIGKKTEKKAKKRSPQESRKRG